MNESKKVSELGGADLDCWVIKALGGRYGAYEFGLGREKNALIFDDGFPITATSGLFNPSANWTYGGPIVERQGIAIHISHFTGLGWRARIEDGEDMHYATGETPLIAAMRCYVTSVFGEEVGYEK